MRELGPWLEYLGWFRYAFEYFGPLYLPTDVVSQSE